MRRQSHTFSSIIIHPIQLVAEQCKTAAASTTQLQQQHTACDVVVVVSARLLHTKLSDKF